MQNARAGRAGCCPFYRLLKFASFRPLRYVVTSSRIVVYCCSDFVVTEQGCFAKRSSVFKLFMLRKSLLQREGSKSGVQLSTWPAGV
ncbi:hypothetical protein GOP47_0000317 [Adiantum capillus-veneris]|uniref:Uncharacterized protein n=1 Tax=Adiantum capillus-veneris TaxID=13818 RepID=A0A9D4VDB7_ADICA|nr:hypothetical protein GOP47_0000317 [Adiantum capillus-veneris]